MGRMRQVPLCTAVAAPVYTEFGVMYETDVRGIMNSAQQQPRDAAVCLSAVCIGAIWPGMCNFNQAEIFARKPADATAHAVGRAHRLDKPLEGGSVHFGARIAQPGQTSAGRALT